MHRETVQITHPICARLAVAGIGLKLTLFHSPTKWRGLEREVEHFNRNKVWVRNCESVLRQEISCCEICSRPDRMVSLHGLSPSTWGLSPNPHPTGRGRGETRGTKKTAQVGRPFFHASDSRLFLLRQVNIGWWPAEVGECAGTLSDAVELLEIRAHDAGISVSVRRRGIEERIGSVGC